MLLKARDPALLKRLIDLINTVQKNNGEIAEIVESKYRETSYFVRHSPTRLNRKIDAFVTFADGTFAISNASELIQYVIDRKTGKPEATSDNAANPGVAEKFNAVAHRLPGRAWPGSSSTLGWS